MTIVYHIASLADWEKARKDGAYTTSTRGRTLEEQGFIHASTAGQTAPVANSFYKDAGEPLVVLVIDTDRLTSPLQHDEVPGWDEPFPHIYGPLNPDAVVETVPLEPGPDGQFTFHTADCREVDGASLSQHAPITLAPRRSLNLAGRRHIHGRASAATPSSTAACVPSAREIRDRLIPVSERVPEFTRYVRSVRMASRPSGARAPHRGAGNCDDCGAVQERTCTAPLSS